MNRPRLLHDLVAFATATTPDAPALYQKDTCLSFAQLQAQIETFAAALCGLGLLQDERVAVYLPKQVEAVVSIFASAAAGGVVVPVNPLLKPQQVAYILKNCNVRVLVTSADRAHQLESVLAECHDLNTMVLVAPEGDLAMASPARVLSWEAAMRTPPKPVHARIATDMAAILYTSGSTGLPKGVVLSHHNMVAAAESTAEFLALTPEDRLLAVLPLSFDYGLSQLTSAYSAGGSVVLMEYLLPRQVIKNVARYGVTGISAVPPIWNQLAMLDWPQEAVDSLRYITTSGGVARKATLRSLRDKLPRTRVFKMYGLTEAFRSSYLHPEEIDERPDSVGKAVPGARLSVVREDGSPCAPGEPGELVHRGSLVAMGYWNDPARTRERFRPAPGQSAGLVLPEIAVWSGDQMQMDEDGYLYFVSRKDEMIKTSGYRVSPTEVEEVVFSSGLVAEAVALGVPHPDLGQAIVLLAHGGHGKVLEAASLLDYCREQLPTYMIPTHLEVRDDLPKNPNGKIDRAALSAEYRDYFVK
ncbi:acyl-CoA ligase (AMP-forming), exosortase A system-associated [Denitromonas iodatirespirans]|uniref:Acyl-CoA ligase (AMP-forming), exosortase A system-associated n=1 Tax=Denitromonas iodatirespirans TaxID=2795389 RepID=A0A944D904_DENI1|nr:acyl-CoA ligase (AMP-forming), exosortase A system-associated [Denitromonas iodatirespirans]MBT0960576.1 acyl-CoA ligase (AMP-forming), exosortase A system-associated [Denitromonas iodatirespirans]